MTESRFAQVVFEINGGKLAVLTAGPAGGECVLMMHGIPSSALLFRDVIPIFAEAGYRVFAPMMPGYGATRLAEGANYSLSAIADLYAEWLQREDIAPVWIVSHDLGVAVAQLLSVRNPQLVTHLSMSDGPIGDSFPVPAVQLASLLARLGLFAPLVSWRLIPNFYMTGEVRRGFGEAARLTDDILKTVFWDSKVSDADGVREFAHFLRDLRNRENVDIVPKLAQLSLPVQLLWGSLDHFQPADTVAGKLLAALPEGTTLDLVDGAGHFMPIETPTEYAQGLLKWRQALGG